MHSRKCRLLAHQVDAGIERHGGIERKADTLRYREDAHLQGVGQDPRPSQLLPIGAHRRLRHHSATAKQ
jgi:hypothetical protein